MFDRLGSRKNLKPVQLKPWDNARQYLLGDVVKAPKRAKVMPTLPEPDTEISPAARHVAAALAKPKKVVVKVSPVATPGRKANPSRPTLR